MKKLIYVGTLSALLLVACGDKEVQKTPEELAKEEVEQKAKELAKAHEEAKKKAEEKALAEQETKEVEESNTTEATESNKQESVEESDFDLFEDDPVPKKGGVINGDQVKAIIEYHALGENDKLVESHLTNGTITATIQAEDNLFADVVYAGAADELLKHEGWDTFTVNFVGGGTVSMNRSQQKDEGYGPYFPKIEIMKQLGLD